MIVLKGEKTVISPRDAKAVTPLMVACDVSEWIMRELDIGMMILPAVSTKDQTGLELMRNQNEALKVDFVNHLVCCHLRQYWNENTKMDKTGKNARGMSIRRLRALARMKGLESQRTLGAKVQRGPSGEAWQCTQCSTDLNDQDDNT
jgi:hypothetical protein